jgi:hypothetical protein
VPERQPRDSGFALGFGCAYKICAESLSERLNHVSHRDILVGVHLLGFATQIPCHAVDLPSDFQPYSEKLTQRGNNPDLLAPACRI